MRHTATVLLTALLLSSAVPVTAHAAPPERAPGVSVGGVAATSGAHLGGGSGGRNRCFHHRDTDRSTSGGPDPLDAVSRDLAPDGSADPDGGSTLGPQHHRTDGLDTSSGLGDDSLGVSSADRVDRPSHCDHGPSDRSIRIMTAVVLTAFLGSAVFACVYTVRRHS